jgi:cytochrome c peroxidase
MLSRPRSPGRPLAPRSFAPLGVAAAVFLSVAGCGPFADNLFCDSTTCGFSDEQWQRLAALAHLPPPPLDKSDAVVNLSAAETLGQAFYFDTRFSGPASQVDALGRPAAVARAPKGQPANVSCASCHDLGRMGVDVGSTPGNVSSGAGWTDVNALATVNSAYSRLFFWNGRADSLWALAAAVAESPTTMNGNRLHTAWVIADLYRNDYDNIFLPRGQPMPIPPGFSQCSLSPLLVPSGDKAGQCVPTNDTCFFPCFTRFDASLQHSGCWPQIPLNGRKGNIDGCQPGDAREPFGDAYDCMDAADRDAIDHVLVNWAKVLEAFQAQLVTKAAPFDHFIDEGPRSTALTESARRGGQLFVGKAGCVDCHNTPLFSDGDFHNVGVSQAGPNVPTLADCAAGSACDCVAGKKCLPWGEADGLARLKASAMLRTSAFSDDVTDMSRAADVARLPTEAMKGAWRTPSLRNVALTAPYMHDGRYVTLEEVVAHYNRGGDVDVVGTRDVRIKPLGLSDAEQVDLVAFLRALTGPPLSSELATPPRLPASPVCP